MIGLLAYWRIGVIAVLLLGLGIGGIKIHGWYQDSVRVAAVEAKAAQETAQARAALASMQERFNAAQAASQGYQDDLAKAALLRNRARALPVPSVRLCKPAPAVQAAGTGASRPDAPPAPAIAEPREVGPDLYGVADDADQREAELAAQVRALQGLLH